MHEATAHLVSRLGGPEGQCQPVDLDLAAGVRAMVTGENLDDRRLARAVLAHEGVHLTGLDVQIEVRQGDRPREGLGEAANPKDGARRRRPVLVRRRAQAPTCQSFSICAA